MEGGQTLKFHSQLEQFVLLANEAKGPALVSLIKQLLEAPGVYVFGEFLDLPSVKKVTSSWEHHSCFVGLTDPICHCATVCATATSASNTCAHKLFIKWTTRCLCFQTDRQSLLFYLLTNLVRKHYSHLAVLFILLKLSSGSSKAYFDLLNVFAYGTYKDYKGRQTYVMSVNHWFDIVLKSMMIISSSFSKEQWPTPAVWTSEE